MTIFIAVFILGLFAIAKDIYEMEVHNSNDFSLIAMILLIVGSIGIIACHFIESFCVQP